MVVDQARASRRTLRFGAVACGLVGLGGLAGVVTGQASVGLWLVTVLFLAFAGFLAYGSTRIAAGERLVLDEHGVAGSTTDNEWFVAWSELANARTATARISTRADGSLRAGTLQIPCLRLEPSDVDAAARRANMAHLWHPDEGCWYCPLTPAGRTMRKVAKAVRRFRPQTVGRRCDGSGSASDEPGHA